MSKISKQVDRHGAAFGFLENRARYFVHTVCYSHADLLMVCDVCVNNEKEVCVQGFHSKATF